jgi:hypothetical protein
MFLRVFAMLMKLTSQKLSMLSLVGGGTLITSFTLLKPTPSSRAVHSTKLWNISQPQSRYFSSPVMRHM